MDDLDRELTFLEIENKRIELKRKLRPWWQKPSSIFTAISLVIGLGGVWTGWKGGAFEEERLQRRIANIELEKQRVEINLKSLIKEADELIRKQTELKSQNYSLVEKIDKSKSSLIDIRGEIDSAKSEKIRIDNQLTTLSTEMTKEIKNKQELIKALTKKLTDLKLEISTTSKKKTTTKKSNENDVKKPGAD